MKKAYLPLAVDVDYLEDEDILTASPDTDPVEPEEPDDGVFAPGSDSNGWT